MPKEIFRTWDIPGDKISYFDNNEIIKIGVSKDEQWWDAAFGTHMLYARNMAPIDKRHTHPGWDEVRRYIIKELFLLVKEPEVEIEEHNSLDRFTNLDLNPGETAMKVVILGTGKHYALKSHYPGMELVEIWLGSGNQTIARKEILYDDEIVGFDVDNVLFSVSVSTLQTLKGLILSSSEFIEKVKERSNRCG